MVVCGVFRYVSRKVSRKVNSVVPVSTSAHAFRQAIRSWMKRCKTCMCHSIGLEKCPKLYRGELGTVITNQHFRKSITTEQCPQHQNGLSNCSLQMARSVYDGFNYIYNYQIHVSFKWACKVHMYALPLGFWPFPRVQG